MSKTLAILTSSSQQVSSLTKTITQEFITQLLNSEISSFQVIMATSETGLMGLIKQQLIAKKVALTIVGLKDSKELITNDATHRIAVTTPLERTKVLYEQGDVLLFLAGGLGTAAEFYGMLDQKVELNSRKPILLYNQDHSYDQILQDLDQKTKKGFITVKKLTDYFTVVTTPKEVEQFLITKKE